MKRLLIFACIATLILLSFGSRPAYANGETYIVQPGDTLFTIAARYGISVNDLAIANGLNNGYWVYAGQQLVIPATMPFLEPPAFAGPANPAMAPGFVSFAPPSESFLARPALPTLPLWPTQGWVEVNAPLQPWLSYPTEPPAFYSSGPYPANDKWIDVDLTRQSLIAYAGQRPVFRTRVSSGLPQYPTVVGIFSIYVKYESADMSGGAGDDAYFLPSVPYVMYFHGNYGLHGTYWHNNFGQPMSHGCVNLPTADAQWLFNWAPLGTKVVTHY